MKGRSESRRIATRLCARHLMQRSLCCGVIILFLLPLQGCWDRREVESLALVQALGLDLAADKKNITVSTMIAIPPKIVSVGGQGGGGGGSESGAFTISMDAPTIYEAFNRINTTVNRDITLLQNTVILIGEDLARQGVRDWMDTLVRFREMRRTELIFICKGKAADMMSVQPKLEKNPAEYFRDLSGEYRRNGMFPEVRIQEFISAFEANAQDMYAPFFVKYQRKEPGQEKKEGAAKKEAPAGGSADKGQAEVSGESLRLAGTAIFKKDRMIGTFDLYESQILLMILGEFQQGYLSVRDPKKAPYQIAFRLLKSGPPVIKYRRAGDINHFQVKIKLEADLMSIQSRIDYTTPALERFLARHIAAIVKRRAEKVIAKAQHYNSDVFNFGSKVRETFLTDRDWVKYDWPARFKDAQIAVSVKVALRRVGVQFQPPQSR